MWNVEVLDYVARNGNQLFSINGFGSCTIYYGSVLYSKWDPYTVSVSFIWSAYLRTFRSLVETASATQD